MDGGVALGEGVEIFHVDFHVHQEVGGGVGGEAVAEDIKAVFMASQWQHIGIEVCNSGVRCRSSGWPQMNTQAW